MSHFWTGFTKQAAKERERSVGEQAAIVGAGTTGALAAVDSAGNIIRDIREERAVPSAKSYAEFKKQLKPGDIMFSRYKLKESPEFEVMGKKLPFTVSQAVQAGHGSPHYHGLVYTGRGRGVEAVGLGDVAESAGLKKNIRGQSVKVYRPEGASAKEVRRAVRFAERAKGTPYKGWGGLAAQALGTVAGVSPASKNCKVGPNGALVCTTLPAAAYPKQFPKEYMTPNEMRKTKGMKLVARYGKPQQALSEKILNRVVSPLIHKARYGLGAAGLAAAALKGKQMYDERGDTGAVAE